MREHPGQPRDRRMLTLDVHDEIDPTTREWVTVDETGHAFMDVDEARADALGAAFETWLTANISIPTSCACCISSRSRSRPTRPIDPVR